MAEKKNESKAAKPPAAAAAAAADTMFRGVGLAELMENGYIRDIEMVYNTKDERELPMSFSGSVMKDDKGKIQGIVCVAKDLSGIKRMIEELKQADQMKSDFMNVAAHELRTPLTPLRGYLGMLGEEMTGELTPEQKEFVNIMRISVERANHLIGDLLSVSRIEAAMMDLTKAPLSIHDVVSKVTDQIKLQIDEAGHSLIVNIPKDIPLINGDNSMIENIVENLLTNAVKYTEPSGKITVKAIGEDEGVHLMVSDTGVGIPKRDQEKIFEKFYQVSRGDKRRAKGVGVGLFIVKYMVEQHKGKVWVESKVGKGSTFHVMLPTMQEGNQKGQNQ